MTPQEREDSEIIFGLSLQAPAPSNIKYETVYGSGRTMVSCPECKIRIRERGYSAHWSKAHRQRHQIDYFKRWRKESPKTNGSKLPKPILKESKKGE